MCVRCEEAEEPVYQGILEVKRGEEDDIRTLKVGQTSFVSLSPYNSQNLRPVT